MKSAEDIFEEIEALIERERDFLEEHGIGSYLGAAAQTAIEILTDLKEWIMES
jgi:hypothetical protein